MTICCFLGLGVMGFPMAGHLAAKRHEVSVWNRSTDKSTRWASQYKGRIAPSPEAAIDGVELIIMCLGDDPDVEAVYQQFAPALKAGQIIIDHTTGSAELARQLAIKAGHSGASYIDAPVSGGQAGAEAGQLTIMAGGEADMLAKAEPVMKAYARQISHIGEVGTGQLAKMVNQICIAGVLEGLAEGLAFAKAAGISPEKTISAISKGAAQSWQMENRWQTMCEGKFDYGFAIDWMRKDLRIALDEARRNGSSLPLVAMVDQYYADIQSMGGGRWDTSSLMVRLDRKGQNSE